MSETSEPFLSPTGKWHCTSYIDAQKLLLHKIVLFLLRSSAFLFPYSLSLSHMLSFFFSISLLNPLFLPKSFISNEPNTIFGKTLGTSPDVPFDTPMSFDDWQERSQPEVRFHTLISIQESFNAPLPTTGWRDHSQIEECACFVICLQESFNAPLPTIGRRDHSQIYNFFREIGFQCVSHGSDVSSVFGNLFFRS